MHGNRHAMVFRPKTVHSNVPIAIPSTIMRVNEAQPHQKVFPDLRLI
jgi:hypothetical protein